MKPYNPNPSNSLAYISGPALEISTSVFFPTDSII